MTARTPAADDPLHEAIAAALQPHGVTNPAAIQAAADAAEAVLGRDRCIHDRITHRLHHHKAVDRCPWCMDTPADRTPTPPAVVDVPTGSRT